MKIALTGSSFHLKPNPNGQGWDVVEVDVDDNTRVISTSREKDDAFIICRFFDQMEEGKIKTPLYSEAHKAMNHLLSLEPDQHAKAIRDALPAGWEGNPSAAFNATARKYYANA